MERQLSASIEVYKLTRAVVAGESIFSGDIEVMMLPASNVAQSKMLSMDRLNSARAARNLAAGKILSNYDIKEKHQVLITQSGIARGQAVNRSNIAMQDYYGKLPQDSLQDYDSAERMQAIRNLAAGSLVRLSDLTPVNIIRKGDNVQLVLRAGALEITVTMLALEDARMDQRVLLLNPESGDEIQAVAAGIGRARSLGSAAK
jgi:flagella basal body P-ring formation protein FlgA